MLRLACADLFEEETALLLVAAALLRLCALRAAAAAAAALAAAFSAAAMYHACRAASCMFMCVLMLCAWIDEAVMMHVVCVFMCINVEQTLIVQQGSDGYRA
jgi:hypothetical protein